jgi:hypothetical protein
MRMFHHLITTSALIIAVEATPRPTCTALHQRDATLDTKPEDHQLSTEAIIGVVGVVVAIIGIASTLAWTKRRRHAVDPVAAQMVRTYCNTTTWKKLTRYLPRRNNTLQPSDLQPCHYAITIDQSLDTHNG